MTILTRGAFARPGTSVSYKTGSWRVQKPVHLHTAAPCHAVCPAGEDAQAWLAKLEEGKVREAWETLTAVNPLPATTGRVCHHPCESACNRGKYDEPIAIHNVERFLGDEAIRHGWQFNVPKPAPGAPQVAVVGAGPGGLTAAYHLVRRGYRVVLFDELPVAGGTLRTALPAYRLPREVLDAEVERILALGVEFRGHTKVGRDITLEELRARFKAVFLAPGMQKGREWSVDGVVPRDLHCGLEMLREWITMGDVPAARSVAIVGGGNTAVDLSRVLLRAGAEEIHIITHQSLPGSDPDAMSAIEREVAQAIEEGVKVHPNRGIRRLILRGERVVGVEMVRMKKMDRGNGKLERVAFEGTETVLHVEMVIPAIGQEVDPIGLDTLLEPNGLFATNLWGETKLPGVFAGGDARQASTGMVSGAVGDGRRAAAAIDRYLRGEPQPERERTGEPIGIERLNLHYAEHAPRPVEPVLPVANRRGSKEIELGLEEPQAMGEAQRCLSCGNCFACDNCWTFCPDTAVLKTAELASDGSNYVFDYDYCKGCGLCANECPSGFIVMQEDI